MEDDQRQQKREDAPGGSGPKPKDCINFVIGDLTIVVQAHGYPTREDRVQRSQSTTGPSQKQKENSNPRMSTRKQNLVPSFQSYDDFNRMVLESLDGCTIILSTDGVILFVDENIVPLLGYLPREIMRRRLLTLLCDEEKTEVYQNIALKLPLSNSEGKHTEFCCFLQRGNVKPGDESCYERVKFILTLRDIFDESFVFFGGFSTKPTYSGMSPENFPLEDRYFHVGTVCVLRAQMLKELCAAKKSSEVIIIYDSDDESSSVDYRRVQNQGKSTGTRALHGESFATYLNDQNEPMDVQGSVPQDNANVTEIDSVSDMHILSPLIIHGLPVRIVCLPYASPLSLMMSSENEVESDPIEHEGPRDLEPLVSFVYLEDSPSQEGSLNIVDLHAPEDSVEPVDQEAVRTDAQVQPATSAHVVSPEPQSSEATFKICWSVKTKRSDSDLKENKRFCDSTHSSKFSKKPENTHVHPTQQYLEEQERYLQELEEYLQDQQQKLQHQKQQHQMMQKILQEQRQEQLQQPKQTQDIIIPVQIVAPQKCSDFIQEAVSEDQEDEVYSFLLEELPVAFMDLPPLAHSPGSETGAPQSPVSVESNNAILNPTDIFMQMWQSMSSPPHLFPLTEGPWLDLQHLLRDFLGDELIMQQAEALDKRDDQPSEPEPFQTLPTYEQEVRSSTQENESD